MKVNKHDILHLFGLCTIAFCGYMFAHELGRSSGRIEANAELMRVLERYESHLKTIIPLIEEEMEPEQAAETLYYTAMAIPKKEGE